MNSSSTVAVHGLHADTVARTTTVRRPEPAPAPARRSPWSRFATRAARVGGAPDAGRPREPMTVRPHREQPFPFC